MNKLSLRVKDIISMRQTDDALLVLDIHGKLWFCEKMENFENIWNLKKFTFTLRKRNKQECKKFQKQ